MFTNLGSGRLPSEHVWSRRMFLQGVAGGATALGGFGGLFAAENAAAAAKQQKHVILLWMSGGPSQFETWDPKPGAPTGGPHLSIPTSLPGLHIDEYMPNLARLAKHTVIVRSMTTTNVDHAAGSFLLQTGFEPSRVIAPMPHWLSMAAHQLPGPNADLPSFVNINREQDALAGMNQFRRQAVELLRSGAVRKAFDLSLEDPKTLAAYDTEHFRNWNCDEASKFIRSGPSVGISLGRQLLLARRLCEAGCGFVTLIHANWDFHARKNIPNIPEGMSVLAPPLDHAVAAFLTDLQQRGLSDNRRIRPARRRAGDCRHQHRRSARHAVARRPGRGPHARRRLPASEGARTRPARPGDRRTLLRELQCQRQPRDC